MPSFGQVALPDINPLFDLASIDRNVNAINGGRLANQLAANTLDSNTQIAANVAEGGGLANQYARQRNPLEIASKRQVLGLDPSPVLDSLAALGPGGGSAPQGQSLLVGQTPVSSDPQTQADVAAEAKNQGVNPDWAQRVHYAESGASKTPFGPGSTSKAGAIGPMQLMPDTAKDLEVDPNSYNGNIHGGVKYLGQMKARYVSPVLATAAYNAGPGRVDDFLAGKSELPPETVAYVGKVFGTDGASILKSAMSGAHGHAIPGAAPTPQVAAAPGVTVAPDAASAAPVPAPVQTATRSPMPGDTASDGTAAPAHGFGPDGQPLPAGTWDASPAASAAPAGQALPDVMARLRNGQAAPQVQNQNALLSVAAPDGSAAPAPVNALTGSAPAPAPAQPAAPVAQPGTGMNSPQVQQAQALMQRATQIEIAAARAPNDPRVKATAAAMAADLRGRAAVIMSTDSVVVQADGTQLHPITGKIDNAAMPAHNPARVTKVDGPGGSILTQPGAPDRVIPYSGRPEQDAAYKSDITRVDALTNAAQSAQASMPRLNEMAELAGQLSTGPTAETRAKAAQVLEQLGASPASIKNFTGMPSGSAAQEFVKLAIATAGSAAKADVGSNNGIQSTQLYQAANPNLGLLPDANKRITNMMRVSAQSIQDYAQAALDHFGTNETKFLKGGDYAPLTSFNRTWQAQANPQVYAAATGILNGDSFEKWSSKINPAEGARAAQIAARVDPTVQIQLKGGGLRAASDVLSHPSIAKPN